MLRAAFLFLSLVSCPASSPGQTAEPEARTMEAVLTEIRQLRQDFEAAAAATRKAQIVIYRLHVQAQAVERATERLENVKNELDQCESQKNNDDRTDQAVEVLKDQAETAQQRKQYEDYITRYRANLEAEVPREQELQAKQMELEADLRTEQAKWDRLEDELDRLENSLANSAF